MQFICLVHHDVSALRDLSESDRKRLDADSLAYDEALKTLGHMVLAHALKPAKDAKVVRRRGAKKLVPDGPFTETKEVLVGFIVIEARDLDEAVEIASHIPLAKTGSIEVRETFDIGG